MSHKPRVLVLDDDQATLDLVHTHLAGAGFEVTIERNPERVMTAALRDRFDLIFTELILSSMTGLEFVRLLRDQGNGVPAIMITASLHGGVVSGAEKLGFAHIIPKPFKGETVVRLARKVLTRVQGDPAVRP